MGLLDQLDQVLLPTDRSTTARPSTSAQPLRSIAINASSSKGVRPNGTSNSIEKGSRATAPLMTNYLHRASKPKRPLLSSSPPMIVTPPMANARYGEAEMHDGSDSDDVVELGDQSVEMLRQSTQRSPTSIRTEPRPLPPVCRPEPQTAIIPAASMIDHADTGSAEGDEDGEDEEMSSDDSDDDEGADSDDVPLALSRPDGLPSKTASTSDPATGNTTTTKSKKFSAAGPASGKGAALGVVPQTVSQQLLEAVASDADLYRRILLFQPIPFEEVEALAKRRGVQGLRSKETLRNWLDVQCICFYSGELTGQRQRY